MRLQEPHAALAGRQAVAFAGTHARGGVGDCRCRQTAFGDAPAHQLETKFLQCPWRRLASGPPLTVMPSGLVGQVAAAREELVAAVLDSVRGANAGDHQAVVATADRRRVRDTTAPPPPARSPGPACRRSAASETRASSTSIRSPR